MLIASTVDRLTLELQLCLLGGAAVPPKFQQLLVHFVGQVLCGGTREEKVQPIFNLFHRGERGGITVRDVATYTTSAFRAMYKLQPSLEEEVGALNSVLLWACCSFSAAPLFLLLWWVALL